MTISILPTSASRRCGRPATNGSTPARLAPARLPRDNVNVDGSLRSRAELVGPGQSTATAGTCRDRRVQLARSLVCEWPPTDQLHGRRSEGEREVYNGAATAGATGRAGGLLRRARGRSVLIGSGEPSDPAAERARSQVPWSAPPQNASAGCRGGDPNRRCGTATSRNTHERGGECSPIG